MGSIESLYISEEQFDAFVNQCCKSVADRLASNAISSIYPKLDMITWNHAAGRHENVSLILNGDFDSPDGKYEAISNAARKVYSRQCIPLVTVLTSECWIAMVPIDESADLTTPVRDRSGRQEAVICCGACLAGSGIIWRGYTAIVARGLSGIMVSNREFQSMGDKIENNLIEHFYKELYFFLRSRK